MLGFETGLLRRFQQGDAGGGLRLAAGAREMQPAAFAGHHRRRLEALVEQRRAAVLAVPAHHRVEEPGGPAGENGVRGGVGDVIGEPVFIQTAGLVAVTRGIAAEHETQVEARVPAQSGQGIAQHQVLVAALEVHPGHFAVEVGREQGLHDTVNGCNPGACGDHQKALGQRVRQHEIAGGFGQAEQVAFAAVADQIVADPALALALHADGGRATGGRGQGETTLVPHALDIDAQQNVLAGAVTFPQAVGLQGQSHRLVTLTMHADHPGAYFAGGLQRIEQGEIVLRVKRRAECLAQTTDQARSAGL